MIQYINFSKIKGKILVPPSKSLMQRVVAASLLAKGNSIIENAGNSNDCKVSLQIIETLGAKIQQVNDTINIFSEGIKPKNYVLNCGESGLSVRMFTAIAATSVIPLTLTGFGSLNSRPMYFFEKILPSFGVNITTNSGYIPITVCGAMQGAEVTIDASISSQFLTGLLMALPLAQSNSILHLTSLNSKPYINLTLEVLQNFGIKIINNNFSTFFIEGNQTYKPTKSFIEGDWSSAAFWVVAAAVAGEIELLSLNQNSKQADMEILKVAAEVGADISWNGGLLSVKKNKLKPFHFNATDCPDLFPPLVALAVCCEGISLIKGVNRLKFKESNRGLALIEEFRKLGANISILDDTMMIEGGKDLYNAICESHNDHRIAMALAIASLTNKGTMQLHNSEVVVKSYPEFFTHFQDVCY